MASPSLEALYWLVPSDQRNCTGSFHLQKRQPHPAPCSARCASGFTERRKLCFKSAASRHQWTCVQRRLPCSSLMMERGCPMVWLGHIRMARRGIQLAYTAPTCPSRCSLRAAITHPRARTVFVAAINKIPPRPADVAIARIKTSSHGMSDRCGHLAISSRTAAKRRKECAQGKPWVMTANDIGPKGRKKTDLQANQHSKMGLTSNRASTGCTFSCQRAK
jgi:hypothetical protein